MRNKQLPNKRRIKNFGEKAIVTIMKEYTQLHNKKVFQPIEKQNLNEETKAKACGLITLVTQKRCGIMKRRGVRNGRQQKSRENLEESRKTSPIIQFESYMLSLLIDSFENRDDAIIDNTCAYCHRQV